MKYLIIFFIIFFYLTSTNGEQIGGDTGLKLPRYVSLKSNDANLRIGSSTNYPIKIKYVIKNLPVEIIDENKNWRKIIDFEKNTGWMHKSLLKGNRYAIIDTPYQEGSQILHKPKGNVIGKIGNRRRRKSGRRRRRSHRRRRRRRIKRRR